MRIRVHLVEKRENKNEREKDRRKIWRRRWKRTERDKRESKGETKKEKRREKEIILIHIIWRQISRTYILPLKDWHQLNKNNRNVFFFL